MVEPLSDVIVEVNSTPIQRMVVKNAEYSFNLPAGTYQIRATYYVDETLVYYTEENITVPKEGNFVLDLIMLPVIEEGRGAGVRRRHFRRRDVSEFSCRGGGARWRPCCGVAFLLGRLGRREEKKGTKVEKVERVEMEGWRELPSDLRLVLSIIEKEGGRITLRRRRSA